MNWRQLLLVKAYSTLDDLERLLLVSDLRELDYKSRPT